MHKIKKINKSSNRFFSVIEIYILARKKKKLTTGFRKFLNKVGRYSSFDKNFKLSFGK